MASASSSPCEEQLLCSICLHTFSEPVSTPCGHNYCKTCITSYWASSELIQCPLCKRKIRKKTELLVNTEFRDMVEHFNNMRVTAGDDLPVQPGEVPCDVCLDPKLKAQKTCLVCLASYCQPHLEPHQRVTALKKHQLIDPVSNLEDRLCQRHDKMFELFCRVDQMCVCFMCLKDDHAMHEAVPLEQVFRERKAQLDEATSLIKVMENTKSTSITEIKASVEQSKRESEKEIADIAEVFTALVVSLQGRQAELIELIQEKQKAAEKQASDRVAQLEKEIGELTRGRSEMEQLLQMEDRLRLVQSCSSLSFPAPTEDPCDPLSPSTPPSAPDPPEVSRRSYVGMVKEAVAHMDKTLGDEMEKLINEVRFSEQPDAAETQITDEVVREAWNPPQDKLMMIQQYDAVDVTLDAYTANSRLAVSEDGKQLRFVGGWSFFSTLYKRRFVNQPFVLGKNGFTSGRFYYEVRVSGSESFLLGVVKESINREIFCCPTPEQGGWTIVKPSAQLQNQYYYSISNNFVPLHLKVTPQTIGVFVDYEMGEVTFYDTDTRTIILSYTGCAFIKTASPMETFLHYMAGTTFDSRPKLYPIVGIFGNDYNSILEISPVARAT